MWSARRLSAWRFSACKRAALVLASAIGVGACEQIGSDPSVPASIEAAPQAFPSVAIGDTLRDTLGVVQPLRVILRNINGDVIENPPIRFLYVQSGRDSALEVDSVSGVVSAIRRPTGNVVQIAARFEEAIQILIPIRVTNEPSTAFASGTPSIKGFVPDTGVIGNAENSVPLEVQVQYRDSLSRLQNVSDWLVRFAVVKPDNLSNDRTRSVFLVDDNFRASQIDTTGGNGTATRRLRIRPSLFPASGVAIDTVEVEAMIFRRGQPVAGAPIRIFVPVCNAAARNSEVPCGTTSTPDPVR